MQVMQEQEKSAGHIKICRERRSCEKAQVVQESYDARPLQKFLECSTGNHPPVDGLPGMRLHPIKIAVQLFHHCERQSDVDDGGRFAFGTTDRGGGLLVRFPRSWYFYAAVCWP